MAFVRVGEKFINADQLAYVEPGVATGPSPLLALHFAVIRPSEHRSAAFQSGPPLVALVLEGDEALAMLSWLERRAEQA